MNKKQLKYFLPPLFIDLGLYLKKKIQNFENRKLINMNKQYSNKYIGETVHVLANGPSLTTEVLESLSGEKVIVMNNFFMGDLDADLDIIACCYGEHSNSPACDASNIEDILVKTAAKSFWLDISLSIYDFSILEKSINFVLPVYEPGILGMRKIELEKPTLSYQTTAQLAIMVAMHMGFKNILLHGFDHNFLAVTDYLRHFYSSDKDETDNLEEWSYYETITLMERMWRIYIKLEKISRKQGINILNCSKGSFLDVFERQTF
tara:strand:+ start:410 stop:1198 length:789 start_codon:yes stop_codon:yes gene_type:complete